MTRTTETPLPDPVPLVTAACDGLLPFTGLTAGAIRAHVAAARPVGGDAEYARRWDRAVSEVLPEKFPTIFPQQRKFLFT